MAADLTRTRDRAVDDWNERASGGCPDENVFARRFAGDLSQEEACRLEDHVAGCRTCERLLADLGMMESAGVTAASSEGVLGIGAELGRYVVRGVLGAGAMGVVYEGYDPELDRSVALKILRPERASDPEVARRRLLLEAQAMARLEHPNVITVHDVGVAGDLVFIAMALIEGSNARRWQDEASRAAADIVRVYAEAGRGLAAAHRVGLVHRDVKPDNILIHEDGRQVVVTDFGLAHAEASLDTGPRQTPPMLTETGMLLGTPRYMSPEQYDQADVGPASDQYSLCVSLYEALHGTHPFGSHETLGALQTAIALGRIEAPRRAEVPAHVQAAIERGMAVDPDARHPSIDALVEALARTPSVWPRRLKTAALVAVPLLMLAVGGRAWHAHGERARAEVCEQAGRAIEEAWNEDVRRTVEQAFERSDLLHAPQSLDTSIDAIDHYASGWSRARALGCRASRVEGRWDTQTEHASAWCLAEQRTVLEALIHQLGQGGTPAINRAVRASASLPRPQACLDERVLAGVRAPAREDAEAALKVRRQLEQARALMAIDRSEEAEPVVHEVLEGAEALGASRLQLDARLLAAAALATREPKAAADELETIYFDASQRGYPLIAAETAIELTEVVGFRLFRADDGLQWNKHAEAALRGAGADAGLVEARMAQKAGDVLLRAGRYPQATARANTALERFESELGPEHPSVAIALVGLARIRTAAGHHTEAAPLLRRAMAVQEASLGSDHPVLGNTLFALGRNAHETGDYAAADAFYRRSLAIAESTGDPGSISVPLTSLGILRRMQGEFAEARSMLERAARLTEQAVGTHHPSVAGSLINLAAVDAKMGAFEAARDGYTQALTILEETVGSDHPGIGGVLSNLGAMEMELSNPDDAMAYYERALAAQRKVLGDSHPQVAATMGNLGAAHRELGHPDVARPLLVQALAISQAKKGPRDLSTIRGVIRLADLDLAVGATRLAKQGFERALIQLEAASLQEHALHGQALRGLEAVHHADARR